MRHITQFASTVSYGLSCGEQFVTISALFHGGEQYLNANMPRYVSTNGYMHTDSGESAAPLLALIEQLSPIIAARLRHYMLSLITYLHDPDILAHAIADLNGEILADKFPVFILD